MKESKNNKVKDKKEEVDLTQFTPDDIAKRFLETPPKPKKKEKEKA
jgi:hypothetical protein